LRNEYEVNGQTAWALLTKAERYRICLLSELPDEQVKLMRITPVRSIAEALEGANGQTGFIMPRGAAILPRPTRVWPASGQIVVMALRARVSIRT